MLLSDGLDLVYMQGIVLLIGMCGLQEPLMLLDVSGQGDYAALGVFGLLGVWSCIRAAI